MRAHDVVVIPTGSSSTCRTRYVYEDDWACVVSADNNDFGSTLSIDDLARLPWVLTFHQRAHE
jgi:hypothetical protein